MDSWPRRSSVTWRISRARPRRRTCSWVRPFFQFQTAHFKGGSELNFGLFSLGEQKLSENGDLPVYCLSAHLSWLQGTMGDRASAVAAAWHGSLEGVKGLCNGGRRLAIEGDFELHV